MFRYRNRSTGQTVERADRDPRLDRLAYRWELVGEPGRPPVRRGRHRADDEPVGPPTRPEPRAGDDEDDTASPSPRPRARRKAPTAGK